MEPLGRVWEVNVGAVIIRIGFWGFLFTIVYKRCSTRVEGFREFRVKYWPKSCKGLLFYILFGSRYGSGVLGYRVEGSSFRVYAT